MEILILQTDIKWLDPDANIRLAGDMLSGIPEGADGPDIIVLPEMFATGFCVDAPLCSVGAEGVLEWMKTVAALYDSAVASTAGICEDGKFYNRFWFVKPDGEVISYDKRHLFTYGGESRGFTRGNRRVTVRWRGFDILLQTCYDLRFPVFSRNRGDYDLAIYCASWPDSRITVWDTLLRARAIENVCYVAGANRVGEDPGNRYPGHSVMVDYKGNPMAGLPEGEAGCIRISLSLDELHRFREKFPALADADQFVFS